MIYFVSGHRNLTDNEFRTHYKPLLDYAIKSNGHFVVGDYYGLDIMAQKYLKDKVPNSHVTVYHMRESPRNFVDGFNTKGGYSLDEERDAAMTRDSNIDIAWARYKQSGTARNIERRKECNIEELHSYIYKNMNITERNMLEIEFYKKKQPIVNDIKSMYLVEPN